jgi:glyoxalase family protein
MLQPAAMHHVSAVSAHISRSQHFYTRVLGLRPVIRTVNQDDPSMYHLFFGDGAGTPGSDMTVFDIPGAVRETRGNNSISLTTFRVAGRTALEFWRNRLDTQEVPHTGIFTRDGRDVLDLEDPEGTRISLVDDDGTGFGAAWESSPIPTASQIRGLGYSMLTVPALRPTHEFLTTALGLRYDHVYQFPDTPYDVHVFQMSEAGPHAEVHVLVREDVPRARHGAGGVHHIAVRVPASQQLAQWAAQLDQLGYTNSGIVDRHYFMSVYVREPNHILFELATDGPGFDVDGPLDGTRLSLPPFLEPRRAEIEARLRPLDG